MPKHTTSKRFTSTSPSAHDLLNRRIRIRQIDFDATSAITRGSKRNVGEDSVTQDGATVSGIGHFDKVLSIDQNPIGHTVRSDVGTYVEVLNRMRDFFATLPLARSKGLQPKHFSYNHRRGMCTSLLGHGLPQSRNALPACQSKWSAKSATGLRLNPVSLEVIYQRQKLRPISGLTRRRRARRLPESSPHLALLDTLIAVGLGYLKLGPRDGSPLRRAKPNALSSAANWPSVPREKHCICLTNRPQGYTATTSKNCWTCSTILSTKAIPWSSSNTTSISLKMPTTSSTWGRMPGTKVAKSSPKARQSKSSSTNPPSQASISSLCCRPQGSRKQRKTQRVDYRDTSFLQGYRQDIGRIGQDILIDTLIQAYFYRREELAKVSQPINKMASR